MKHKLHNRNFLALRDFSADEIRFLLDLADELKAAKRAGTERPRLSGRNIVLLFEKDSTRTRCAFEVAIHDQGAHATYIGPSGSHMGSKESVKDTARVLGRMFDGIEYRGFSQSIVETLAEHAGVPVWNGLTDEYHPTQVLGDFQTMREHCDKPLEQMSLCFIGDGHSNVATSLMIGCAKLGLDYRIAAPTGCHPRDADHAYSRELAAESGARITVTEDIDEAVRDADFLYTDVWVSMGESEETWAERIQLLKAYQVNAKLIERSGNPDVRFLHCLPAFHNRETKKGEAVYQEYGLDGMEVTEDVFESERSVVFDQAENRMHTIKAVMVATLGD